MGASHITYAGVRGGGGKSHTDAGVRGGWGQEEILIMEKWMLRIG